MKLFKDFKIIECKCFRDVCDECYNTVDKDVYISSVALTEILNRIEKGESDD